MGSMRKYRNWIILIAIGLGISIFITLFSPFASSHPDGLERVAEDKGFIETAKDPSYKVIPDYTVPGVESERFATILSGVIGVVIVAGLMLGVGYLLSTRAKPGSTKENGSSGAVAGSVTGNASD